MTALSDAVAAAQAELGNVNTALTALQAFIAADTTKAELVASEADAASATTSIASLTTGLTTVAAALNTLATPPAPEATT